MNKTFPESTSIVWPLLYASSSVPEPPPEESVAQFHVPPASFHFNISLFAQPRKSVSPSETASSPEAEPVAPVLPEPTRVIASASKQPVASVSATFEDPDWSVPEISRFPEERTGI